MAAWRHPAYPLLAILVLAAPSLGFGPEVEADPMGLLRSLVEGHREVMEASASRGSERRTLVLQGKLRKEDCDTCDGVTWTPVKGSSTGEKTESGASASEGGRYSKAQRKEGNVKRNDSENEASISTNWESKKFDIAEQELDSLTAPLGNENLKVTTISTVTKKGRNQKLRQKANTMRMAANRSRKPKKEAEFPKAADIPETVKITSSFAGRPRFSLSQNSEGEITISPELKGFQLELKPRPMKKVMRVKEPIKMAKAIKIYKEKEIAKARTTPQSAGFGGFPNFDTNIRSGFGSFGNKFGGGRLNTRSKPRKVSFRPRPHKMSYQEVSSYEERRPFKNNHHGGGYEDYGDIRYEASRPYEEHGPPAVSHQHYDGVYVDDYHGPSKVVPKREVASYSAKVPKRGGIASNLYVEDPWKDVNPTKVAYDPKPYNPRPSYDQGEAFSLVPDFGPSYTKPYQQEPAYSPEPYHPEPSYEPEPYHPEPAYNPEPYHPEPAYNPKPYHTEPSYSPEPYHPEPAYSPEPYHPEPAYSPPPKPSYNYEKPNFRPPIAAKPYVKKSHDVIKVPPIAPYVEPHHEEPYKEPSIYQEHKPYHEAETHHEPESYHVAYQEPEPYHETYHEPEPYHETYHEPEPFIQPELFRPPNPFFSRVSRHEVFLDNEPEVFRTSPAFGAKTSGALVERSDGADDGDKGAVTFHNPTKVPAPDVLPFLEVTQQHPGTQDHHDSLTVGNHYRSGARPRAPRRLEEPEGLVDTGAETGDLGSFTWHADSPLVSLLSSARFHGA